MLFGLGFYIRPLIKKLTFCVLEQIRKFCSQLFCALCFSFSSRIDVSASVTALRRFKFVCLLILFYPIAQSLGAGVPSIVIHCSTQTTANNNQVLQDINGIALDSGQSRNGDGALITLGYYSEANNSSLANHFNGNWIPLTEGTRIGDSSSGYGFDNGMFSFTSIFKKNSDVVDIFPSEPAFYQLQSNHIITNQLPRTGTPLCIRFYDSPELSSSTKYNAVTGPDWLWPGFSSGIPENLYLKISNGTPPNNSIWKYGNILQYPSDTFKTTQDIEWIPDLYSLVINQTDGGTTSDVNGSYPDGTNLEIIATPNANMQFVGWLGDGVSDPLFPSTVVEMTMDRNITAVFAPMVYKLETAISGVGTVEGGGEYSYGDSISLTAEPSLGYEFSHWVGPVVDENSSVTSILITQDIFVQAVFLPKQHTLNANTNNILGGEVFIIEDGPYRNGSIYNLLAIPKTGYIFSHWSSPNGAEYMLDSNLTETTKIQLSGDASLVANFDEIEKSLIFSVGQGGQSISPQSGSYGATQLVPISATPILGYKFLKWQDPEGIVLNPYSAITDVNMSRAKVSNFIMAMFTRKTYEITITEGTGGNVIFDNPNGPWYHFGIHSLQAVAQPGYKFISWNGSQASIDSLAFENNVSSNQITVTNDIALHAHFTPESFFISVSSGNGGTATGTGQYLIEEIPQLEASPEEGWEFSHWEGNETQLTFLTSPQSKTTLVNLAEAPATLFFEAVFKRPSFTISVNVAGNGEVFGQKSFSEEYESGTSLSMLAEPLRGWKFNQWFGIETEDPQNPFLRFDITSGLDLVAEFSPKSYSFNVTDSVGGDANGSGTYSYGSTVLISAIPSAGYKFLRWEGDIEFLESSASANSIFTIPDSNSSLTPVFEEVPVSISSHVIGQGHVSGIGTFPPNSEIILEGTGSTPSDLAPRGYRLIQWSWQNSEGELMTSSQNPLVITPSESLVIMAEFEPIPPEEINLTIQTNPENGGFTFDNPDKRIWNLETDSVDREISVTPKEGYSFLGWVTSSELNILPSWRSPLITISPTEDTVLTAKLEPIYNKLNVSFDSAMGSISEYSETYLHDSLITLTAKPKEHHTLLNWTINNEYSFKVEKKQSNANLSEESLYIDDRELPLLTLAKGFVYSFDLDLPENEKFYLSTSENEEITFESEYTTGVTNSKSSNGILLFEVPVNAPDTLYYKTSNDHGNKIEIIEFVENEILNFPSENSIKVSSKLDLNLTANFAPNFYSVHGSNNEGGVITELDKTFIQGSVINLEANPLPHHEFLRWEGSQYIENLYQAKTTLTVLENTRIHAVFAPILYPVNLYSKPEGVASFSVSQNKLSFPYGSDVEIEVFPLDNYKFLEWEGDATGKTEKKISLKVEGPLNIGAVVATDPIEITISTRTRDINGQLVNDVGGIAFGPTLLQRGISSLFNASGYEGFEFSGWYLADGSILSNSPDTHLSFNSSAQLFAEFKKKVCNLNVDINPKFLGTLTLNDLITLQQLNQPLAYNSEVEIQANALGSNRFDKWILSEDFSPTVEGNKITFTIKKDLLFSAQFLPPIPPFLSINVDPPNTGMVVGEGFKKQSQYHYIFASAKPGYVFEKWLGQGINDITDAKTYIEYDENRTIIAQFKKIVDEDSEDPPESEYLLNVLPSNHLHGKTNPLGENTYSKGTIPILAEPKPGYTFSHWEGSGVQEQNKASTFLNLNQDTFLAAIFEPESAQQKYVNVSKKILTKNYLNNGFLTETVGGTIIGGSSFAVGYTPTFKAYAKEGFEFVRWENEINQPLSTNKTITFASPTDFELRAIFKRKAHFVTVYTEPAEEAQINWENIGISSSHSNIVADGTIIFLSAIENKDYKFLNWLVDQDTILSEKDVSLQIKKDTSFTANFYPVEFKTIEVNSFPEDGGWVLGGGKFAFNPNHLLLAKPNAGFKFERWEGAPVRNTLSSETSINLNQNYQVWAIFEPDLSYEGDDDKAEPGFYVLEVNANNSIYGKALGSGVYGVGWRDINAIPYENYEFSHWEGKNIADPNQASSKILIEDFSSATAHFKIKPLFSDTTLNDNGWGRSLWFGNYWNQHPKKWAFHIDLGWVYALEIAPSSYWVWVNKLNGWYWVDQNSFPYMFENSSGSWVFLSLDNEAASEIILFQFSNNQWRRI